MRDGRFSTYVQPDPLGRTTVFDVLEDAKGVVWLATPGGLGRLEGNSFRPVIPGAPVLASAIIALGASTDGAVWAGSYGKGLWRVRGDEVRHFTAADGLPSEQIITGPYQQRIERLRNCLERIFQGVSVVLIE